MRGITNSIQNPPIRAGVVSPPITTSYLVGDALNTSGILVKIVLDNGKRVTPTTVSYSVPSGDINNLQTTDTYVTVTATYIGKTFTTSFGITVKMPSALVTLNSEGILGMIENKFGSRASQMNTAYGFVKYNDIKYTTLGDTFEAEIGSSIIFYQYSRDSATGKEAYIILNGVTVASTRTRATQVSYTYTVPSGTSNIVIDLTCTKPSNYTFVNMVITTS